MRRQASIVPIAPSPPAASRSSRAWAPRAPVSTQPGRALGDAARWPAQAWPVSGRSRSEPLAGLDPGRDGVAGGGERAAPAVVVAARRVVGEVEVEHQVLRRRRRARSPWRCRAGSGRRRTTRRRRCRRAAGRRCRRRTGAATRRRGCRRRGPAARPGRSAASSPSRRRRRRRRGPRARPRAREAEAEGGVVGPVRDAGLPQLGRGGGRALRVGGEQLAAPLAPEPVPLGRVALRADGGVQPPPGCASRRG